MRVLGIDPGGQYLGLVVREGDRLLHTTCLERQNGESLQQWVEAALDSVRLMDELIIDGVDLVAVEGVSTPSPHMGTISVTGLLACSAVLGAVIGWCWTEDQRCVVVPPGKHGSKPDAAYPSVLTGRRPPKHPGVGPRKHEKSAWDVAGAGRLLARVEDVA